MLGNTKYQYLLLIFSIRFMSDRLNIHHAYEILGLKLHASPNQVKQAYHELAKTWHPDRFLEPQQKQEAEEKIKTINDAIVDDKQQPSTIN